MPRKNAHRGDDYDSGILVIDDRTKAVMTDQPRHAQEAFKDQIARVREVVQSSNKDDIALVLQAHDGDVDKTIQSFMEDGAKTVLNEWQSLGKKGKSASKRNKKKRKAQQNGEDPAGSGAPPPGEKSGAGGGGDAAVAASSKAHSTSTTQPVTNHSGGGAPRGRPARDRPQSQQRQYQQGQYQQGQYQQGQYQQGRREDHNRSRPHPRAHPSEGRGGEGRPGRGQPPSGATNRVQPESDVKNRDKIQGQRGQSSAKAPSETPSGDRLKQTESKEKALTDVHLPHIQDTIKARKLGAVLERSSKDLHRTSVALMRHKGLLRDHLDQSEKSITKSFEEIQRFLNERKLALTNEFLAVKRETTDMLASREDQAKELERRTLRGATMSEEQLLELRAEIKQFVSDRKVDEEVGKALRFTWSPDQLIEHIKTFGEVVPVHHHYTTRRPSVSSLSSFNTVSRTTSVSEDPAPLSARSVSLTESQDSSARSVSLTESQDSSALSRSETAEPQSQIDMKLQVAELAAKIQRGLQGHKGPRNPRGPNPQEGGNQGQKKGERSQQPNRGKGQAQGQRSEQDQGQGPNPNKSGRNQNRQDRSQSQQGARQGQQRSRQGQGSHQGQQQQTHQQPVNGSTVQGEESKASRNAKRRQNNNRRQEERKRPEEKVGGSGQEAPKDTNIGGDNQGHDAPSGERTDTNKPVKARVSVASSAEECEEMSNKNSLKAEDVPEVKEVEAVHKDTNDIGEVDEPKDTNGTPKVDRPKEDQPHITVSESTPPVGNDSAKIEAEVKIAAKSEPKTTNGPLVNGDIKLNGDVPHVNGDIIPNGKVNGDVTAPLPQREAKSRRSQKLEEVVKETTVLNGVVDFEPTEREN